jgi:hypothetical protein
MNSRIAPSAVGMCSGRTVNGTTIFHRVGVSTRPECVFQALTIVDGVRGWWVSQTTGDASTGGTIDFGFCQMQVIEALPGKPVRWHCFGSPDEWVDRR